MSTFENLKRRIFEKRWGVIHFEISETGEFEHRDIHTLLNSYVEGLGFQGIGSVWREVDLPDARRIVTRILHKDLAYNQELMPLDDAQTLASEIVDLFSRNVRFYTNGDYALENKSEGIGWCPISNATFDTGVIFVDEPQLGLIWVEDED